MDISLNSLMLAIKAIQRDIERREALLDDDGLSDEEADEQGHYVMDLTQALGEIGDVYEQARGAVAEAPSLETLLGG